MPPDQRRPGAVADQSHLHRRGVVGSGRPKCAPNRQTGCWAYAVLPFVEQQAVVDQDDQAAPVKVFLCPTRGRDQPQAVPAVDPVFASTYVGGGLNPWTITDYAANWYLIVNRWQAGGCPAVGPPPLLAPRHGRDVEHPAPGREGAGPAGVQHRRVVSQRADLLRRVGRHRPARCERRAGPVRGRVRVELGVGAPGRGAVRVCRRVGPAGPLRDPGGGGAPAHDPRRRRGGRRLLTATGRSRLGQAAAL